MRVFVTRKLPGGAIDRLAAEHDVEVWPDQLPPPRDELMARVPEVEGLLSMLTDRVDAELMDAAPRLRAISNYAVGVDNVDVEAATARGLPVGNTPGVLTDTTADLAVALMLGIARRLAAGDAYVRRRPVAAAGSPSSCWGATCTAPPWGSSASAASARRSRAG